jgi:hypothetical protein
VLKPTQSSPPSKRSFVKSVTGSSAWRTTKCGQNIFVIALLVSSLISAPAFAETYPCTADDLRHCNLLEAKNRLLESEKKVLEDQNKKLEKLLLEKPQDEVSIETMLLVTGVVTVASFCLGGFLGAKL